MVSLHLRVESGKYSYNVSCNTKFLDYFLFLDADLYRDMID